MASAGVVHPMELNEWMADRQMPFASAAQIGQWCGCEPREVSRVLRRAREEGRMIRITRGGWVPYVERYGQIESRCLLPRLMKHLGADYYIGYACGAAIHGASHQAVQVTQVAASKRLAPINKGRNHICFVHKSALERFPTVERDMLTYGYGRRALTFSTPEVTMMDIVQRPDLGGSWYNAANIAAEMIDNPTSMLSPVIDPVILAETALLYPAAVRQRAGYVLQEMSEHVEQPFDLSPLRETIPFSAAAVNLERPARRRPRTFTYDARWRVRVEHPLDPDV